MTNYTSKLPSFNVTRKESIDKLNLTPDKSNTKFNRFNQVLSDYTNNCYIENKFNK